MTQADPENTQLLLINLNCMLPSSKTLRAPLLLMVMASPSCPMLLFGNTNILAAFTHCHRHRERAVLSADAAGKQDRSVCGFVARLGRSTWLLSRAHRSCQHPRAPRTLPGPTESTLQGLLLRLQRAPNAGMDLCSSHL